MNGQKAVDFFDLSVYSWIMDTKQQPDFVTWYMPALADVTLDALNQDAMRTIDMLRFSVKAGTLTPDEKVQFDDAMNLHTPIETEKVYRQTVRLAQSAVH